MKVILLKSVSKLGQVGDIKSVADGYARNYLLPNNLVALATSQKLADFSAQAVRRERLSRGTKIDLERARHEIGGRRFEWRAKTNERGTLFAGVTSGVISGILKGKGYEIEPTMIELPQPLKRVGDHEIVIDFGSVGKATIIVEVKAIERI